MKEKKIYIIVISLLFILLLLILGLIIFKKNENNLKTNPNKEIVYTWEMEEENQLENIKIYTIEMVTVKANRVLKTQTGIKYVYSTKELFDGAKINNPEGEQIYNAKDLSIIDLNKEYTDYTVDEVGVEINVTYDGYQEFLKELGYTCHADS